MIFLTAPAMTSTWSAACTARAATSNIQPPFRRVGVGTRHVEKGSLGHSIVQGDRTQEGKRLERGATVERSLGRVPPMRHPDRPGLVPLGAAAAGLVVAVTRRGGGAPVAAQRAAQE